MTGVRVGGDAVEAAIAYHERTKHHFQRYARSLGYLDWANQPDPFRRYAGARRFLLPFDDPDPTPAYDDLFSRAIAPQRLTVTTLARFLEQSLGISASKSHAGSTWKLRCNPSSGNLHPTEGYVLAGPTEGLSDTAGVYHYVSDDHTLELRAELGSDTWVNLTSEFPAGTFFCGLSSVHWREAWKYGERAFRYSHHDVGHALGAVRLSAASLGWRCAMLDALGDDDVDTLLGLTRAQFAEGEPEHGELILAVLTEAGSYVVPTSVPSGAVRTFREATWTGSPNRLSEEHTDWEIIPATSAVCRKPRDTPARREVRATSSIRAQDVARPASAGQLFRQRRSAVAMDGTTSISRSDFYRILDATMPSGSMPPFDVWPYAPSIDLALFVHRVDDVSPGAYVLARDPDRADRLRGAMRADFEWARPEGCPETLPLFRLAEVDCRGIATQVSCLQEIAGDGAFSLGMLADFHAALTTRGAWYYPRLFWEAGLVGQVLYLEAEAAGVRATGIGCYFDDAVHDVFGLRGRDFQSMYHFTVGGAVDDPRITGLPPYAPERRSLHGWT